MNDSRVVKELFRTLKPTQFLFADCHAGRPVISRDTQTAARGLFSIFKAWKTVY